MVRLLVLLLQAAPFFIFDPAACDADPVDLSTGIYYNDTVDFRRDDSFPIELVRTYRTFDDRSRSFGIGSHHNYDIFLVGDNQAFAWIDLILPDGSRVHYVRASPGTSWVGSIFKHTASPGQFYDSTLRWSPDWNGWDVTLTDGTLYQFPPSDHAVRSSQAAVVGARNRKGKILKLLRNTEGDLMRIVSPGGRRLDFEYDGNHRVIEAWDDRNRIVRYRYDDAGRLSKVVGPTGKVTLYTYDGSHRLVTLSENGTLVLTNQYDDGGRVKRQILGSGGEYNVTYRIGPGGRSIQTDLRDPVGRRRRAIFNDDGYIIRDTNYYGTPYEETSIYEREPGTNRIIRTRKVRNAEPPGPIV